VIALAAIVISNSSCVSKKKYDDLQAEYDTTSGLLSSCEESRNRCTAEYSQAQATINDQKGQINSLNGKLNDCNALLAKESGMELIEVGNVAVLSPAANKNLNKTLTQAKYTEALKSTKTKLDSVNLALAGILSSALKDGMNDKDINIHIDNTVVMIDLSDKMLFTPGKSTLTPEAKAVLAKVAKILESRKDLEVMVEGYTDNNPVKNDCVKDNWDLSVLRATSVVRVLQHEYKVDPSRIIAAGRGEYRPSASNDTKEGRAANRHTSIIIMPKLDQFYNIFGTESAPAPAPKPAQAPAAKPVTTTTTKTTTTVEVLEAKEKETNHKDKVKAEGVEVKQTTTTTTTTK
jgi:chemotaxis protein MotB